MAPRFLGSVVCLLLASAKALRYDPSEVDYNLNQNETATIALDYWGEWKYGITTPESVQQRG
jgi:hypothetical protein